MKSKKKSTKIYFKLKIFIIFFFFIMFKKNKIIFIPNLKIFKKLSQNKSFHVSLVVPITVGDFFKIKDNFKYHKKFIDNIYNLIFIGNENIRNLIKLNKSFFEIPIKFISEKNLIDVNKVKNLIKNLNQRAVYRSGWYIQQFLKMQYSYICEDDYYLIWDSDTIPVKKVILFNNDGKPYFHVMNKYFKSYFDTMKVVFPELGKKFNFSFVSEHMLIKTEIMKNLIERIKKNKNLKGETWYEKVLFSIKKKELPLLGFSEFETFGTFAQIYYNKPYNIKNWKSLRNGKKNYNYKSLTSKDLENISRIFDAISFEK